MKQKLGDFCELINGDRGKNYPSQEDIKPEGDVPFVNAGHLNGKTVDFTDMNFISKEKYDSLSSGKFQKNDILYCLRGSLGKKAIIEENVVGAVASSLVIIRPYTEVVDVEYLLFALDSPNIKSQLSKANNGSSQPNLSAASVRQYEVDIPDLTTQRAVAKRLEKVNSLINNRLEELRYLDDLIKARFVEMFVGKGLPEITVREVLETGFWLMPATPDYVENGTVPYITSKNIKNREIDFENVKYITEEDYLRISVNRPTKIGDILVSMIGTLGQTAVITSDREFYGQNLYLLRLNGEVIDTDYFCEFFNSHDVQHKLRGKRNQSTQAYLKANHVEDLVLPLASLEEQKRFAQFVKQVDKSKVATQKSLDETQLLFDSLMQEYFG